MKNNKFLYIVIACLIAVILMQRACQPKPKVKTEVVTVTEVDTIRDSVDRYIPEPVNVIHYVHDTLTEIDTQYVVQDYLSKYFYKDTIDNDSVTIVISDTISKNRIASREVKYSFLQKNTTTTITNYEVPEHKFYVGGGLMGNRNELTAITGGFLWKTKQDQVYGLGVGINNQLQPVIQGQVYWKLGK